MAKAEKTKATLAKIKEGRIILKPEIRKKLALLVHQKKQDEAVVSGSSAVPKSKYDDDDDDDDKSTGSGETTFDETKTMKDHKIKLSGWGITNEMTDKISYAGMSESKYDALNSIAKKLFQDNEVDRFVNMVSSGNGKGKRKMKKLAELKKIIQRLK